jgi:hypothetical protein
MIQEEFRSQVMQCACERSFLGDQKRCIQAAPNWIWTAGGKRENQGIFSILQLNDLCRRGRIGLGKVVRLNREWRQGLI